MTSRGLIVTTSKRPDGRIEHTAAQVAARCGLAYVPRRQERIVSVDTLCAQHDAFAAYVVSRQRHELRAVGGGRAFVNPGPLHVFRRVGRAHPLLRALSPEDEPVVEHVVDATLGLAKNAICTTAILGCELVGLERSPVMASLLEEGLARLAADGEYWSEPAARIQLHHVDAAEWLEGAGADTTDAVYLDPMFEQPIPHPMTDVFRLAADTAPLSERLLRAAMAAARRRVVMRVPGTWPTEKAGPMPEVWAQRITGKHVDYLVARP